MLQVVSERDEARANRDRLAHELAAARAQIAQLRRTRPDRTHARRLEAAQTALADVASLAQVQAISCRAQHRADHERNWLDVLAIIERADLAATTTPEETQPQGTERVQWGYEDANGGRYFTSEEVARAVANGESGYAVGIGRVPVVAGLRRTVTEFEPIVGEWEPVEETQPDEEPFVSGYCENGACDRCVQGPEMNLDGRMLAEECTHACHEETQP